VYTGGILADRPVGSVENSLEISSLQILGLPPDANDQEILSKLVPLDPNGKAIIAMDLIARRRITAAVPIMQKIVNDSRVGPLTQITAADALRILGDRSWVPTIEAMLSDPNDPIRFFSAKLSCARMLAEIGDYSLFGLVIGALDQELYRGTAIDYLGSFAHPTEPCSAIAAAKLLEVAKADPSPWFRERAICSLDRLSRKRPSLERELEEAIAANINSEDLGLKATCKAMLEIRKIKAQGPNKASK